MDMTAEPILQWGKKNQITLLFFWVTVSWSSILYTCQLIWGCLLAGNLGAPSQMARARGYIVDLEQSPQGPLTLIQWTLFSHLLPNHVSRHAAHRFKHLALNKLHNLQHIVWKQGMKYTTSRATPNWMVCKWMWPTCSRRDQSAYM